MRAGVGIPAYTMLRSEKCLEIDSLSLMKNVNG